MKLSHSWLKEYVDFRIAPSELAEGLSLLGLEVENVEDQSQMYAKFVVGEVEGIKKHPNADRLTVCSVNVGSQILEIVCGASNVEVKQKVALGLIGATIPHNQHDPEGKPVTLVKTKIRGVESNGMICSAYELGLGDDRDGIFVLKNTAKIGEPLAKYLGKYDVVYEIEITANRGDWLSHLGVAREIGALVGKKASLPKLKIQENTIPTSKHASIAIVDKKKCLRYVGRVVRNVNIQPSPQWLQDRLQSVGIRPVNNIVDVTNYLLMETGQPLHAFDYDRIARHSIKVQSANDGDRFVTLDGKERVLNSEVLLVCDAEKPLALAGVMGGLNSEIMESTKNVFIESAYFLPSNIRRTSKLLGLSTDASQRFERGVDIERVRYAADRAAQLIQELAGGEILRGAIDTYPEKVKTRRVGLRVSRVNEILGTFLTKPQIIACLRRLEVVPLTQSKNNITFSIPSFRHDLLEEIDLVEEVARIYGYNNIETKTRTIVDFSQPVESGEFEEEVRRYFVGGGFNEIKTYSLQDKQSALLTGERYIEILNPVSVDAGYLRTSLLPGALQVVRHNRSYGQNDLRMFELGAVFFRKVDAPENLDDINEEQRVMVLLTGSTLPQVYDSYSRNSDLFDLKGEVDSFLKKFLLDKYCFISYDNDSALTEPTLSVEINGTYAGFLGRIKKSILEEFDIEDDVFVCDLKLQILESNYVKDKRFRLLPRYPKVTRDVAFIVDRSLAQEKLENVIREMGGELLEQVRLFDVFIGEQVGTGKKSLAYALKFQPKDRTLTDKEIDEIMGAIIKGVVKKFNARLRDT